MRFPTVPKNQMYSSFLIIPLSPHLSHARRWGSYWRSLRRRNARSSTRTERRSAVSSSPRCKKHAPACAHAHARAHAHVHAHAHAHAHAAHTHTHTLLRRRLLFKFIHETKEFQQQAGQLAKKTRQTQKLPFQSEYKETRRGKKQQERGEPKLK